MKKAFGQTVRELKREVNKKVLKVPGVEQKVLDATSNEPWGPHGSLLADIAQATRNYHEYQMIMQVVWKRINDTGKNWRHVYKALTVLDYLVAHGSERVIDEIREHAYQISTLSDFQYIDSNGRDQGSNVRKKSQSLVVLVNDKERILEVRQKAAANRDKFRNTSTGGLYRPGSGGYDDDRYGGKDEDRNGYGREREYGDDRYGDRQSRDSDERYGRDDDYRGRSQSVDGYRYSERSRSADRERERGFEDDGQYSSRGSAKADDYSQDGSVSGKRIERKFSEPNLEAPPSYEDAIGEARSPVHSERGGETPADVPKVPAPVSTMPRETEMTSGVSAPPASVSSPPPPSFSPPAPAPATANKEVDSFDEFDPRGPFAAAPTTTTGNAEMDFLDSFSDSFSSNVLAIMPATAVSDADATSASFSSETTFSAAPSASQPFDDPFGDGPFRAITTTEPSSAQPTSSFVASPDMTQSNNPYGQVPPATMNSSFPPQDFPTSNEDSVDILADILGPSGPSLSVPSETMNGYSAQAVSHELQTSGFPPQQSSLVAHGGFPGQMSGFAVPQTGFAGPTPQPAQQTANYYDNYLQQQQQAPPHMVSQPLPGNYLQQQQQQQQQQQAPSHMVSQPPVGPTQIYNNNSNFLPQSGQGSSFISTASSQPIVPVSNALALVPQPAKDKFETKSTVWADTLSRGLVNLNISGPKTNPLSDIGVDFDAINRREKRMEKPTTSAVTSTITMGKAMGSGTGIGRAGAGAIRPQANPMAGPTMGMGPGGGYGGQMNQHPMGTNMGMGQNMGMGGQNMGMGFGQNMGMGMNMGGPNMGMGMNMQGGAPMQPMGFPPGTNMPGGYNNNPMMGRGGYSQQPPYGGGYR